MFLDCRLFVICFFFPVDDSSLQRPQGSKVFGKEMMEGSETIQTIALQTEKPRVAALEKEIQSLQKMLKQQQSALVMDHGSEPVSRVGEKIGDGGGDSIRVRINL